MISTVISLRAFKLDQLNARIQSGFHYMLYVDIFIGEGVVVALTTPMLPVRGVSSCNFWPEEVSNLMLARSTNSQKIRPDDGKGHLSLYERPAETVAPYDKVASRLDGGH